MMKRAEHQERREARGKQKQQPRLLSLVSCSKAGMVYSLYWLILSMLCVRSLSLAGVWGRLSAARAGRGSSRRLASLPADDLLPAYRNNALPNVTAKASLHSHDFGDMLVIPLFMPKGLKKNDKFPSDFLPPMVESIKGIVSDVLAEGSFLPHLGSKLVVRLTGQDTGVRFLALVGLGESASHAAESAGDLDAAVAQKLGKAIGFAVQDAKVKSASIVVPNKTMACGLQHILMGLYEGLYTDSRYKLLAEQPSDSSLASFIIHNSQNSIGADAIDEAHARSRSIAAGHYLARDLVNSPSNSKNPVAIARQAQLMASELGMECKVLEEAECAALGMGAYLGVQQGSRFPPQFLHLTYRSPASSATPLKVVLIGKGLTFDSGGYNLKSGPLSMIQLMKFDMGGAGAVLGAAKALGLLRPQNVELHFISALCENMVSASAYRPGDILVASNRKTIEIGNTDAEGRLTLADALVYAQTQIQGADVIMDLATLTGSAIEGLGPNVAALFSTSDCLRDEILAAAKTSNELLWTMPLEESYKDSLKSPIADLKNIAGQKGGGSITAALFLKEFVGADFKGEWAHIDMAGPVWDYGSNGATGYGVKLLVDLVERLAKDRSRGGK